MTNPYRFLIVAAVFVLSALAGYRLYYFSVPASGLERSLEAFPHQIGEWTSDDIPISQRTYDLLETHNLIMRNYKNGRGEAILLYIVYSPDNRKVAHPPEICLEGDGATITKRFPVALSPSLDATALVLEKERTRDFVVYWYRVGTRNTHSYLQQQLNIMTSMLRRETASAAFIRLMTNLGDQDVSQAQERIKAFSALIEPLLDTYMP